MGKSQSVHIVPNGSGAWSIKQSGVSAPLATHNRQSDAIDQGRSIARDTSAELFIHGRNGQIRARDSHGNDPFPPKG